ncbi:MAG: signal peptide prediction [Burkholderiales bacterium]|nr:signal peptide prediction [Burkholderiales bacterium]
MPLALGFRVLWALPVSVLALPLLPLALWRGHWRATGGALEITSPALSWFLRGVWFRWLAGGNGFAAATIGQVIIARDADCLTRCRAHELAHVRQCLRWGPLFPFAYIAAGLYAAWRARAFQAYYWDNAFEREARAAEEGSQCEARSLS